MATVNKSNMAIKGSVILPGVNAPLPDGAALFADFAGSRFVMKYGTGQVKRSANLNDVLSFSRGSEATRVGLTGLVEYLGANEPAMNYHPLTGTPLGIRTESMANNRLVWSKEFTRQETWTPTGITLTANDAVSPDGNMTATKIIESGVAGVARSLEAITTLDATAGKPYAFSLWIKANTASVVQIAAQGAVSPAQFVNFDVKTGKITRQSRLVLQATMEPFRNGWYRCSLTINPTTAVSPRFTLALVNNDSSADAVPVYTPVTVSSLWIWGAQAEQRDGASSYIPTSGAVNSRAGDICTTPTNADFVAATGGTIMLTCIHPRSIQSVSGAHNSLACAAVIDNSAAGAHLRLAFRNLTNNNGQAQWATSDAAGTSQSLEIYSLSPIRDAEQSMIFSFDKASMTLKLFDGFNWYSRTATSLPDVLNRICIGRSYIGPENWFNGYIKKLIYWPAALSETEMEEVISYR
ncbi:hypothetical protein L1C42_24420 [Klebsiella pneumoniae]|uniref:phage head spike fiber domain-containing protein n=1 Tax=Klebsiella pneumoniae TaxID=573 RepID=UPI0020CCB658|nr:hypothetical protein [Klebsiella pneumoniae]MCQ0566546.1 hypothetical protein [Klebsiella pneumoniae]MCQ0605841.1 hypothetical protein [Klebsiella pneumoniae]